MKILYLCHQDNYHIRKWIPALRRNGLEIVAATLKPADSFEDGTPCYTLLNKTHSSYLDFFRAVPRLIKIISIEKPDLIFASYAPGYGLSALLSAFRPFVVQTWSRDAELPGSLVSWKDHLIVKTLGRLVLRKADGITADGLYCKSILEKTYPAQTSNIHPTPWGIDLEFFEPEKVDEKGARTKWLIPDHFIVLFSPRGIFWYYQPEKLLPAFLEILNRNPSVLLILPTLGHVPLRNILPILEELKKHPRVVAIDRFLNPTEMRELWSLSDFFISAPKFDGVSEAISEGRSMGVIPILNEIGSNLERANPNEHAVFIDDNSSSTIAQGIQQALDLSLSKLNEIKNANLNWVRVYADVNKTATDLSRFLKRFV